MDNAPSIERDGFLQILKEAFADARETSAHLGLLLIDIANLGRINHHHGYRTGDHILAAAHRQLLEISKLPDSVYRIGSHRFAFILRELANPVFIALAMNKLRHTLEEELYIDADMVGADLKFGVAINRSSLTNAMAMFTAAESSLSYAKLGGGQVLEKLFEAESVKLADYQLEQRFDQALYDNDFELYFQPKVHLATGEVRAAEALLRWFPEDREPVPPEMVAELAESSGRAYELTKWVIHRGLRQMKEWRPSVSVDLALNVQAGLVGNTDLPPMLRDALSIWGVTPGTVTIEITEDALIEDKESGFQNLLELKALGVNISIDDFGTGYSSLSYFKHIPAGELKIDRTFVSTMLVDPQDMDLVKIMVQIAHKFGLTVVAEGVESEASLDVLREIGCDYAQGYYFSKPLPADEFERWLQDWKGLPG